jgi:perosamine synthetase
MKNLEVGSTLSSEVLNAIREITGPGKIPLHEPSFEGNEWSYLKECLDSTYVSSIGKFVDQFEEDLARFTGAKHAISVVNGTAALHIALKLAGVIEGDEVLIPALTFVATANAVTYCNAVPHFVDSEEVTLGINVEKLRDYLSRSTSQVSGQCLNTKSGRIIRALVPMHTFGHPNDLDGLQSVASQFNIALVEDAAESLGSLFKGKHTGTFGLLGTLSFNGNKTVTTGGGGAILTNDSELAKKAKHLTTTAKTPHVWEFRHDEVGFNYRMPNLNAALGCAQLELLPGKLLTKRKLFKKYEEAFVKIQGVNLFAETNKCQSNYWLQTLILDKSQANQRDLILEITNKDGIMTRPAWDLINTLPPYRNTPTMDLTTSESLVKRIINIPSSPNLAGI